MFQINLFMIDYYSEKNDQAYNSNDVKVFVRDFAYFNEINITYLHV